MTNTKDQSELLEISDKFTEETLKDLFYKVHKSKDVEILSWDFGAAGKKGDSYLATLNRITVRANVDSKLTKMHLVVKSLPRNPARKKTFRSVQFFRNEIIFYEKIIPKYKKFLSEKGKTDLLCVPNCLMSLLDGENDYLVLEDATPLGFGPITRQNTVDVYQCATVLKTMAKFHAISLAYKDQKKEEFEVLAGTVEETYFSSDLWDWYQNFHRKLVSIAQDALSKEYPGSEAEKRFKSYKFGDFYNKCVDLCSRVHAPTSVISQGDSWAPNFLIRTIEGGKKEVLMLDFQLARCASPVLDISFFLCACTDQDFRNKHFDEMLKVYHDELSAAVKSLGSDPKEVYPWATFMKEVKEMYILGIVFSFEAVPFCLLSEAESFDLDVMTGEEAMDISNVWTISNIQTKEGRQRLATLIVDGVARGYF